MLDVCAKHIPQLLRFVASRLQIALIKRHYDCFGHRDEAVQAVPLDENAGEAAARIVEDRAVNAIRKLLDDHKDGQLELPLVRE